MPPAPQPLPGIPARPLKLLFAFTSFLSAFLLFQVQLIVSKHILPWFGGSAAVWTTSLLVFQLLLLAGYVYAHVVFVRLSAPALNRLHSALLAMGFLLVLGLSFAWPSAVTPGASWKPLSGESPVASVVAIVLVSVGFPFFVLSATAPLLQGWFARLGSGVGAYRLYSVSNLGSLLGLLTFPFLIEPALSLRVQGILWSALFCLFAAACALCSARSVPALPSPVAQSKKASARVPPGPFVRGLWFLLAACASSLLLATTNLLCQEVLSVPLLWVVPLSLYLLSFILCFDLPRWYQRAVFHPLFAVVLFLACAALAFAHFLAQMVALPLLLFLACMVCHGELVRLKPDVHSLTSFYLTISAGGAAGGLFVALIAPRLFASFAEFQWSLALAIILLLATLVRDPRSWIFHSRPWLSVGIALALLLAGFGGGLWLPQIAQFLRSIHYYPVVVFLGITAGMGAVMVEPGAPLPAPGFRFIHILIAGIALFAFAALYLSTLPKGTLYLGSRSFYGVIRVFRHARSRELVHGQTSHGAQFDPPLDRLPTGYYGANSGVGVILRNHPGRHVPPGTLRVGVVGLGVGTLAAFGLPGDSIRFYELNPEIAALSSGDHPPFTYLRDSAAAISVVLGDARLSLQKEAATGQRARFDVLVLDAFNGDSIPVHLLTSEAFDTYWQQLDPRTGIIAVHITSRHVDLAPVLQAAAAYSNADYLIAWNPRQGPVLSSGWFLLARDPALLRIDGLQPITVQYHGPPPRLWTDDYSDIFRLIY